MNLLNALKLTALMTAGTAYGAFAQQKPQVEKKKPQTEIKSVVKGDTTSTYESKRDSLDRLIMERKTKSMWREEEKNSGKTVEVPELPKLPAAKTPQRELTDEEKFKLRRSKQTDEQNRAEDSLMQVPGYAERMWKALGEQKKKAQTNKDQQRLKELEDQTAYLLQHIAMLQQALKATTDSLKMKNLQRVDSIETNNYIYNTVEVKPKKVIPPWEFSTGPTRLWIAGPKADPNRDQLGPIDDHYNIVQTPVNGWFVDVTSRDFDAEGFLSLLSTEFYVAIFNGVELPELVSIGDTDNSGLYEYTVDGSKLLTYGQASLNMGKEFRAGMFGFEPKLNLGVHYQDVPELKMKDSSVKTDRWTEQAMEANRFSAFGKASFRIAFYPWEEKRLIEADKEKNAKRKADKQLPDKEKTRALVIYLGINAFDTTQKPVQANPYSGVGPFNGKDQFFWHVDLGLAYKF
jgi:hypothetical protein